MSALCVRTGYPVSSLVFVSRCSRLQTPRARPIQDKGECSRLFTSGGNFLLAVYGEFRLLMRDCIPRSMSIPRHSMPVYVAYYAEWYSALVRFLLRVIARSSSFLCSAIFAPRVRRVVYYPERHSGLADRAAPPAWAQCGRFFITSPSRGASAPSMKNPHPAICEGVDL